MRKLVFVRHGESEWNKLNKFTGWTDVGLTEKGLEDSEKCGKLLKKEGFEFNLAFSSVLRRSAITLELILDQMNLSDIEIKRSWRLNERFYGALQGLNKSDLVKKFGKEQVHQWRRSYNISPPKLTKNDSRFPGNDVLYANIDKNLLPLTESLEDVVRRVQPYWDKVIMPAVESGRNVLISAHGNSIRAMIKILQKVSSEHIVGVEIPTCVPIVYELQENMGYIRHYFLGDETFIQERLDENKIKP